MSERELLTEELLQHPQIKGDTRFTEASNRRQLSTKTVSELKQILQSLGPAAAPVYDPRVEAIQVDRIRMAEESRRDMAFFKICRTPLPGNKVVVENTANRHVIEGWVQEDQGETFSQAMFIKAMTENPKLLGQLVLQSVDVLDPRKQAQAAAAQAEEDRKTFNEFARANGFSENEANWSLTKSILGPGFNSFQLENAVSSNALRLAPASPAELETFRTDAQQLHQDWLLNARPQELRQAAKQESEVNRAQAQQQDAQYQIAYREKVEAGLHPVLPEVNSDGAKLDAAFFKRLADSDIKVFRKYCSKYGFSQVTARLNAVVR